MILEPAIVRTAQPALDTQPGMGQLWELSMTDEIELAPTILLITSIVGADNMAEAVSERAGVIVELVRSRRAALASLRRYSFDAVMIDATLPDGEATPTDLLWQNVGDALPIEIDLRALGASGIARMLRGMLTRRDQMEVQVREQVTRSLAEQMRGPITGLLLQSDLMLRDQELTPTIAAKVRAMRDLADDLRVRLRPGA